jgi:archaellum component FlaC
LAAQVDSELDAAAAQKIRDEILDFCQSIIMKGKDTTYITDTLEEIADEIEKVRKDYRNPSAHTNQLQKINAKECFDLVLDVEKILRTIIESLDY